MSTGISLISLVAVGAAVTGLRVGRGRAVGIRFLEPEGEGLAGIPGHGLGTGPLLNSKGIDGTFGL